MNKTHFIEVDELQRELGQHHILDCRFALGDSDAGRQQYLEGHIPGARYAHLETHLSGPTGPGRHPLPSLPALAQTLAHFGIDLNSSVVLYDDNNLAFAARAWWLLRAVGLTEVRLLNGGYSAWQQNHGPVQQQAEEVVACAAATLHWQSPSYDFEAVAAAIGSAAITLVDSRDGARYRGEIEPIDAIAGHIPTALNKDWQQVCDGQGFVQEQSFHQRRWQQLPADKPLVIYCGSGVTACVNILSASLAGVEAILYPGSWSDWCNHPGAAIAIGDEPS